MNRKGIVVPRLIVTSGIDEGREFEMTGPAITLGRESTCAVRLLDSEVSRRHAEITCDADGGWHIADCGSANGVLVNGRLVQSGTLQIGDRIRIGNTDLLFGHLVSEPSAAPQVMLVAPTNEFAPTAIVRRLETHRGEIPKFDILYEASHAASHILDLDELLPRMLDLLFQSVKADRGCVLLGAPGQERLKTQTIRWRLGPRDDITVSRTIVDYVLQKQEAVLVTDAASDERFAGGQSVVRQGIREAICVPLSGRHEQIGILYFDTLRPKRYDEEPVFSQSHLELAVAVGRQIALAVEENRHYEARVQAERLAAVGQAVAALSHHIKNILQGMRSGHEVLKLGLADRNEGAVATGLRALERNQQRVYDLVMDMLSYSKNREPNWELVDVSAITSEVAELLQPRAKELGIDLVVKSESAPRTLGDPEGIHRAVLNLLSNAIDAVSESVNPQIRVSVGQSAESVAMHVQDNGIGIGREQLGLLFEPFVSTKGERGTGLGLAVSRKIAREHGGDITVTSTVGAGSTFTLTIPIRDNPPR